MLPMPMRDAVSLSAATSGPVALDRRTVLKAAGGAAAGLALAVALPVRSGLAAGPDGALPPDPKAFLRIRSDDIVSVIVKHLEMGQGSHTGLATLVAEELDADWARVRVEPAPAEVPTYGNLSWGGQVQGTGGSSSIANSFMQMRRAGAAARAMLVAAAAAEWGVPAAEITVADGVVTHAKSGRSARFGKLARAAMDQEVPQTVTLKSPAQFKLIGKDGLPRVDVGAKSDGSAIFGIDLRPNNALIALVARAPRFGGVVKGFDPTAARAVPGVVDVVQIGAGIAVVAEGFWAASKGRNALKIEWDESAAEKRGTAELLAEYKALAMTPGLVAARTGEGEAALAKAARRLEATFSFPYLAHAPMEPENCLVILKDGGCEIYTGCQLHTIDQGNAARALGITPDKVKIFTLMAGGSFGRRANAASDFIVEAVEIAKAIGGKAPVKLIWTREDDIRGGRYRPMFVHRLVGGLDASGNPVAWHQRIVGQSIIAGTPFEGGFVKDGIDITSVEGASNLPYAIAHRQVELHSTKVGVPVLWWRSVGHTHTAYATEVFLDEIARAGGKDPVALRLALLKDHPRHAGVLKLAAEKAGWGTPLPPGRGRGVAVHESFNSFAAHVAEVSIGADGAVKVERLVCAIDCGIAVNPDVVRAQIEGGSGFGLSAFLGEAITLDKGRVVQSNFHDYTPLRLTDMPQIEVHIVRSDAQPTGVGEPGVPTVGPAVANAIAAATGKVTRDLPLRAA